MTDHHDPEGGELSDIEDEGQVNVVTDIEDNREDFPPGFIVWARYVGLISIDPIISFFQIILETYP